MEDLVCLKDFAEAASAKWDNDVRAYFNSGADDEYIVEENRTAYNRWRLRPRFLRDVSKIDMSVSVLGKSVSMPIGVSPSAMQCVLHEQGELATVAAADSMETIFILSLHSTKSLEEVAASAPNCRKWFQLPLHGNKEEMLKLVKRAETAGFEAIVLSVDTAGLGKRRQNRRVPVVMPKGLVLANLVETDKDNFDLCGHARHTLNPSITWEIIRYLKSHSRLPIITKGIQTAEDAVLAINNGSSAIFVSNHGGRQLDCVLPTVEILPEIVETVKGKAEIYLDGGIMRGSDVFRALALGADMVFVGRGILWGLGVGGQEGVEKVLDILRDELEITMTLSGTANVDDIDESYIKYYC